MATYEVEHNIPAATTASHAPARRRPDFSTFHSTLALVDTTSTTNPHSVPLPSDIAAANRGAAEAYSLMLRDSAEGNREVLEGIIEVLLAGVERPGKRVDGVGQGFLDELERVPTRRLRADMECPICGVPFLDDEYPLVVRLPCHPGHLFDLECIAPWLKLHSTCPLDRVDLVKRGKKLGDKVVVEKGEEEEEGGWDGMYA